MLLGDYHLHTNLSQCADQSTTAADYLPLCARENVRVLGFSNHIYYELPNGVSGVENALKLRAELDLLQPTTPIKLLLGGEIENVCGKPPSMTAEQAKSFDYVLIAASHICNLVPWYYEGENLTTPEKVRAVLLERFFAACNLEYPVPCGICHPLYPICSGMETEVVNGISDSVLADCFTAAAKTNKSIEIHICLIRDGTTLGADGLSPVYMRVLQAAKDCGCKFHFGSDAHRAADFENRHAVLYRAAEKLALCDDDFSIFAQLGRENG